MDKEIKEGQIFVDEDVREEKQIPVSRIERYKNKIISIFQTVTIISHVVFMAMFFIIVFGVIDDVEGKSAIIFAFSIVWISLMSIVIYSPKIIEAIAKFIMWVMKKLGKIEERYIKWFCIVFSLLPVFIYIAFVLSFSFLYLFI